jgi:hypothetical protein
VTPNENKKCTNMQTAIYRDRVQDKEVGAVLNYFFIQCTEEARLQGS